MNHSPTSVLRPAQKPWTADSFDPEEVLAIGTTKHIIQSDANITMQIHLPSLPKRFPSYEEPSSTTYHALVPRHMKWKSKAMPWLPQDELERSCPKELRCIKLGFPAISDTATILSMAAWLVTISHLDDVIEPLEIQTAENCIKDCEAILDGTNLDYKFNTNLSISYHMAMQNCKAYRELILDFFEPLQSRILQDAIDMLHGQLPEMKLRRGFCQIRNFEDYLDLRAQPFGLIPIITLAELFFIPSLLQNKSIRHMASLVVRLAIIQNDLAGIEKDLAVGNSSNSLLILGKLRGQNVKTVSDLLDKQMVIHEAEEKHDTLIKDIISTWSDVQDHSSAEECMASDSLLGLCISHFKWSFSTTRYTLQYLQGSAV